MENQEQSGFKEMITHVISDVAKAVCERPGESRQQQIARTQAAARMVLNLRPRDVLEAMLSGQSVMLHAVLADSIHDSLLGEIDVMRRGTRSNIVALNRAFHMNINRLDQCQRRPSQGTREASEGAVARDAGGPLGHVPQAEVRREGASRMGHSPDGALPGEPLPNVLMPNVLMPNGVLSSGVLPTGGLCDGLLPRGTLPCGTLPGGALQGRAFRRALQRETSQREARQREAAHKEATQKEASQREVFQRTSGHGEVPRQSGAIALPLVDATLARPQPGFSRPVEAAAQKPVAPASPPLANGSARYHPSPEQIAACQANPEAMAALAAGDAGRFARAMGVQHPSEAYLAAAAGLRLAVERQMVNAQPAPSQTNPQTQAGSAEGQPR
jgi:hypothetical protein